MSQENLEVTTRYVEAAQRRDVEAIGPLVTEDLEIFPLRFAVDGTMFRGPGAARDFFAAIDQSWEGLSFEVEQLRDSGDQVVAVIRVRARGSASGAAVDTRTGAVATFKDGRIKCWRHYSNPSDAFEAVGLAE